MLDLKKNPNIVHPDYSEDRTIVLIPNIVAGDYISTFYSGLQYFEERYLYFLLYLSQPKTKLVLVLTDTLDKDYYSYLLQHTSFATGYSIKELQTRITLIRIPTTTYTNVVDEINNNDEYIERIKQHCNENTYIEFWRVVEEAIEVANKLELPWYGLSKKAISANLKDGSKQIFAESGVKHAQGLNRTMYTKQELYQGVKDFMKICSAEHFFIKINDSASGLGVIKINRSIGEHDFETFMQTIDLPEGQDINHFFKCATDQGLIIEEFIAANHADSPSVQFEITPDGTIKNVASHDQIIINDVEFDGLYFPANEKYKENIIKMGFKVAKTLQNQGALGFVAIDMLVTDTNDIYAIEINARKGGSNHTHYWAKLLTHATYNEEKGMLECDKGDVVYRGTEQFLKEDFLKKISISDFLSHISSKGLDYNHQTKRGVFIHLLSFLPLHGKFGCTIIGRDKADVQELEEDLKKAVLDLPKPQ